MSIHLFKHNQEAYNSVTAMLERGKMAAVIHPTGTWKDCIRDDTRRSYRPGNTPGTEICHRRRPPSWQMAVRYQQQGIR